jgi:hypothetical protein
VVDVSNGMTFFSPLWRHDPTVCMVHHIHTNQWGEVFNPALSLVGRGLEQKAMPLVYRNCLYIALSASTADGLAELGVDDRRIRVVPAGVEPAEEDVLTAAAARADADPDREPLFLALGRLMPQKRYDLLLELWEQVRPVLGGRLVIAGDGPELARLRGMAGRDAEVLGEISHDEKLRLLADADLFLHPAMHEGWGLVILEAATYGAPALGFRVPGVRDAIVAGATGDLAETPREFAAAWIDLVSDRRRLTQLGRQARERALEFSWDASVDRFEAVMFEAASLQHVTHDRPRRRRATWEFRPRSTNAPTLRARRPVSAGPAVSIVVPAYDEAERLPTLLDALTESVDLANTEIIIVDDGSSDETATIAESYLESIPMGRCIRLAANGGKGRAVRTGVAAATGESIVFMDADLATDLSSLTGLLAALDDHHVVVGSRSHPSSQIQVAPGSRKLMGRVFNRMCRQLSGLSLGDTQCGFKAFRAPVAKLLFNLGTVDGFAFDVEVLMLAHRIGFSITEVPVQWRHVAGSKVRPIEPLLMTYDAVRGVRNQPGRTVAVLELSSGADLTTAQLVESARRHMPAHGVLMGVVDSVVCVLPGEDVIQAEAWAMDLNRRDTDLKVTARTIAADRLVSVGTRPL